MADSNIILCVKAIATWLGSLNLSLEPVVERNYAPKFDAKYDDLIIFVIPYSETDKTETAARSKTVQQEFVVNLAIMQAVASPDASDVDPLINYVDELKRAAYQQDIGDYSCIRSDKTALFDGDAIRNQTQFAAQLQLTLKPH